MGYNLIPLSGCVRDQVMFSAQECSGMPGSAHKPGRRTIHEFFALLREKVSLSVAIPGARLECLSSDTRS